VCFCIRHACRLLTAVVCHSHQWKRERRVRGSIKLNVPRDRIFCTFGCRSRAHGNPLPLLVVLPLRRQRSSARGLPLLTVQLAGAKYRAWEDESAQRTAERRALRRRLDAALEALQLSEREDCQVL
jgi:hypothetical protein